MSFDRRQLGIKTARIRSKSKHPTSEVGWCLREVRECLAIPQRDPTAAAAYHNAKVKHPITDYPNLTAFLKSIPRGAPVFWLGGADGAGHVALPSGFLTRCYSTDILRDGYFDRVPISLISEKWPRLHLVGWTADLNGVPVYP